jgi:hypothetical protein
VAWAIGSALAKSATAEGEVSGNKLGANDDMLGDAPCPNDGGPWWAWVTGECDLVRWSRGSGPAHFFVVYNLKETADGLNLLEVQ